jgi:uncharacterized membrane protein
MVCLLPLAVAAGCSGDREVSFQADVAPILKTNCAECHDNDGEGYTKSGFNVMTYEAVMKGTRYGPVVIPGNSVSSTLARLITGKADASINMPHNKHPIPEEQMEVIVHWIDQGAKNN